MRAVNQVYPHYAGNAHWDDMLQAAAIGVWKAERKYAPEPLSPQLIYTAARFAALTYLRDEIHQARKTDPIRTTQPPLGFEPPELTDPIERAVFYLDLTEHLASVEPKHRGWLTEYLLGGVPMREAAERHGVSFSAANTRWQRKLRPALYAFAQKYTHGCE